MLYDLETSTIGLRRGWSVSRALSWAVCFADKTRAHGNLRQVWLHRRLCLRWIRGERGKSELNAGKRQFGRLQLLRPCTNLQLQHKASTQAAATREATATRVTDNRTGRRKAMRIAQHRERASTNAWARRRPTWGGRARQAQQIHARRWTRRRKYTLPWNGSTCGACRRARTCVQRLARAPLAHAALADAHAKRQFPADGCTVIEWLLRHDASAC